MRECDEVYRELAKLKHSPGRLAVIFYVYSRGNCTMEEIEKALRLAKSSVWTHIQKLKDEGLLETSYAFGRRPILTVRITPKGVEYVLKISKLLDKLAKCIESQKGEAEKGSR